jgi:hypothetical protein
MRTDLLADLPSLLVDQIVKATPGGSWTPPMSVARTIFWLIAEAPAEIGGCDVPVTSAQASTMEKSNS